MPKQCPQCNEENREQARYCISCNYDLTLKDTPVRLCPSGRHSLDPSWPMCPYCVAPRPPQPDLIDSQDNFKEVNNPWVCAFCREIAINKTIPRPFSPSRTCACGAVAFANQFIDFDEITDDAIFHFSVKTRPESFGNEQLLREDIFRSGVEIRQGVIEKKYKKLPPITEGTQPSEHLEETHYIWFWRPKNGEKNVPNSTLKDLSVKLCSLNLHSIDISWNDCPYCLLPNIKKRLHTLKLCSSGQHWINPSLVDCPHCLTKPTVTENLEKFSLSELKCAPIVQEDFTNNYSKAESNSVTFIPSIVPIETPQEHKNIQNVEAPGTFLINPGSYRHIVGILISYTWKAEGQVFAIREGRNYIGRDNDCEVALPEDSQMSSKHATIICRDGKNFMIDDEKSMNGTFVNDILVKEKQQLLNYSKIKTGSTVWTFTPINNIE